MMYTTVEISPSHCMLYEGINIGPFFLCAANVIFVGIQARLCSCYDCTWGCVVCVLVGSHSA